MLVKFSRNLNEMSWHIWHVCITVYCLGPYFRYFADHKRLCEDLFNIPILCGKKLRNGWDLRLRLWCDCGCGSSASTPFFKTIHFNKNWKVTMKANQGNFKHLTCSDYVKVFFVKLSCPKYSWNSFTLERLTTFWRYVTKFKYSTILPKWWICQVIHIFDNNLQIIIIKNVATKKKTFLCNQFCLKKRRKFKKRLNMFTLTPCPSSAITFYVVALIYGQNCLVLQLYI